MQVDIREVKDNAVRYRGSLPRDVAIRLQLRGS